MLRVLDRNADITHPLRRAASSSRSTGWPARQSGGRTQRLVLLRQRDRVAGRLRRVRPLRRRPDLVGLPRLDRGDAGPGGGRLLARAVRARVPGQALRRRTIACDGSTKPCSRVAAALRSAGVGRHDGRARPRRRSRSSSGPGAAIGRESTAAPARPGARPKRRLRPLRRHQEAPARAAEPAGSARREHRQGRRAGRGSAARRRPPDLGRDRHRREGGGGRRGPARRRRCATTTRSRPSRAPGPIGVPVP